MSILSAKYLCTAAWRGCRTVAAMQQNRGKPQKFWYNEVMNTKLVVAALLLTVTGEVALAADPPEHPSKNARPALVLLAQLGLDNAELVEFADYVDQKIEKDRFHIAQDRYYGGTLEFNYVLSGKPHPKQLELRYAPDNSNFEATAGTDRLLVYYRLKF